LRERTKLEKEVDHAADLSLFAAMENLVYFAVYSGTFAWENSEASPRRGK
jgi:hypothetical protein